MNKPIYPHVLLAILVLVAIRPVVASSDQDRVRALSGAGTIIPLEQLVDQLRQQDMGQLLEVELETDDTGHYYEVEVLDNGQVRKLIYDATTGDLLSEQNDD